MWKINECLINGLDGFKETNPDIYWLIKAKWIKKTLMIIKLSSTVIPIVKSKKTTDAGEFIGNYMASYIKTRILKRPKFNLTKLYHRSQFIKRRTTKINGLGGHTWINPLVDSNINGRIIKDMIIIYHDANKAGKHLDIHIGHLSFIIKVSGKTVENDIKFNSKGVLTEASKNALMQHIRNEIFKNSRIPQNLDHSLSNAKCTWYNNDRSNGYGSGFTRQIVSKSKVEFYHTHLTSSLHMYAPIITPHQGLYFYKIYNGKVPISIWGRLIPRDHSFEDRLHLKLLTGMKNDKNYISTRKYDGASIYFTTTGEGFKFFSPRISKITGHRIEYTYKLPELAEKGFGPIEPNRVGHTTGMAEVLFYRQTFLGKCWSELFDRKGPENLCWNYLTSTEIGGILNSHSIRPLNVFPEIQIYRIDKFINSNVTNTSFLENRKLQLKLSKINKYFNVVKIVKKVNKKWEGLVTVHKNESVNNGYKIKERGDLYDWRIDNIKLYFSEKGNIAGIIECTSLDSGKKFNLGPNQIGNNIRCRSIIENPDEWIGLVFKVHGFNGHEGRAVKVKEIHLDK